MFCLLIAFHRHWWLQFLKRLCTDCISTTYKIHSYLNRNNTTRWLVIIIALARILELNSTLFFSSCQILPKLQIVSGCGRFIEHMALTVVFLHLLRVHVRNSKSNFPSKVIGEVAMDFFFSCSYFNYVVPSYKVF